MLPYPALSRLDLHPLGTAPERAGLDRLNRWGAYGATKQRSRVRITPARFASGSRLTYDLAAKSSLSEPMGEDTSIRTPGFRGRLYLLR